MNRGAWEFASRAAQHVLQLALNPVARDFRVRLNYRIGKSEESRV